MILGYTEPVPGWLMLAIWRAEQTSWHPVPGFQRLQWLAGIPDHNPAEYLNKSILEERKLTPNSLNSLLILFMMLMLFSDFMWFHFSRCFQMFSFCSGKLKNPRQATEAGRIVLAPSIAAIGLVGLLCAMCIHVAKYRGISQTNPFGIL